MSPENHGRVTADSTPPPIPPDGEGLRFKELHRKLEAAVAQIEQTDDVARTLESILDLLIARFESDLDLEGGRIYERRGSDFYLCCGVGSSREIAPGLRVPREYPPHLHLLQHGMVIMERGEVDFDEEFEQAIGVGETFAAIGVGEGITHIIGFSIRGRPREDELLYSLTVVRHVINLKLQRQHFHGLIEAARVVQESLLPSRAPDFPGFEFAERTRPAEIVSGDAFDYPRISEDCLGIAVADSSGHGLPAAMLARDVITALRMASGYGQDVVSIVNRLNGVIHEAALSVRFASLFYGQLSSDGGLRYCNAGHEHPLLVRAQTVELLSQGGTVLGPLPDTTYRGGSTRLEPGDVLVLFTDGIVERENEGLEQYTSKRLVRLVTGLRGARASEIVDAIFEDVDQFARDVPAVDDMTVVVVRRRE
jgi:hypothetical protein